MHEQPFSHLGTQLEMGNTYAGFPIAIVQTKNRGRIVVATRDLKAGDIVLRSMAYMTTVCDDFKTTVCATCFRHAAHRLPVHCHGCRELYFCDEACRELADHFPTECQALKRLHQRENRFLDDENSEIRMILRVLAKASEERKSNGKPQHDQIFALIGQSDPALQQCKAPMYADYCRLVPNDQNYGPEIQQSVRRMAAYVRKIFPQPEASFFDEEEIYNLFFREKCNCFGIWDPKDRCLASAVFPSASFFNHSCIPNCSRFPDQPGLITIRTLYPVPAGTELNISYITLHDASRETRMEQLRYYYCFECGCSRCADFSGASDSFMEEYLCKRSGCTGLIVPIETNKATTVRRCRVCPYQESCNYPERFCGEFKAPHQRAITIASPAHAHEH